MKLKTSPFQKLRPTKQLPFLMACCCCCSCCVLTLVGGSIVSHKQFKSAAQLAFPENPQHAVNAGRLGATLGLVFIVFSILIPSVFSVLLPLVLWGYTFWSARYSGMSLKRAALFSIIILAGLVGEFFLWVGILAP